MRKLGAVLVLATALALAGCASQSGADDQGGTAASADSSSTAAPITMAPEDPTATPTPTASATDADFIAAATYSWRGAMPSDSEFLAARDLVCQQLRAGTPVDDVRVVEGETEDAVWNNDHLVTAAVTLECPEFDD